MPHLWNAEFLFFVSALWVACCTASWHLYELRLMKIQQRTRTPFLVELLKKRVILLLAFVELTPRMLFTGYLLFVFRDAMTLRKCWGFYEFGMFKFMRFFEFGIVKRVTYCQIYNLRMFRNKITISSWFPLKNAISMVFWWCLSDLLKIRISGRMGNTYVNISYCTYRLAIGFEFVTLFTVFMQRVWLCC